ncbi:S1C family serine protease [Yoonia sp. SS1-5]|uniref:S1C family serine protease n=1 Tax=Yoonia rhodophyticola TaxID=3137370 RepID=A0AAN0NM53_9RHOB
MAEYFITKTSLEQSSLLLVDDNPVLAASSEILDALRQSGDPGLASFLAEPLLSRPDAQGQVAVSWYCDTEGTPRPMEGLSGAMREDVADRLAERVAAVRAVSAANPDLSAKIDAALSIIARSDVLVVGGQPVLINWGAVPRAVVAGQMTQAAHFDATFGELLPRTSEAAVPFTKAAPAAAVVAGAAATGAAANAAPADTSDTAQDPLGAVPVPDPDPENGDGGNRPSVLAVFWPLAALCVLMLLVLIWLLLPGTRLFPPEPSAVALEMRDGSEEALRDINRGLEERIAMLEDGLENGICTPEGDFILPSGRTPEGLLPPSADPSTDDARLQDSPPEALVPPNPERVQVPQNRTGEGETEDQVTGIVDIIEQKTVLVIASAADGTGFGTGFFVAPNIVFTNHHVIESAIVSGEVLVMNEALGVPTPARIIRHDGPFEQTGGDFALLEIEGANAPYFDLLAPEQEVKGQAAIAAGFPFDIVGSDVRFQDLMEGRSTVAPDLVITNGIVNTQQQIATNVSVLVHSASISKGNSGGPLVDMCGRVIGMNTFVSEQAFRNLNIAQSMPSLLRFLGAGQGGEVTIADSGCAPNITPPQAPTPAPEAEAAPAPEDTSE